MICIIALVVFGIMGIFSATHRKIAKEAFDCVFRKITLRKCDTGLDIRLKSQITAKFMKWPKIAGFLHRKFEIFSWIFTIIMFWSIIQSGIATYNFTVYGNCNGPVDPGFCIFDPLGTQNEVSTCGEEAHANNIDSLIVPKNVSQFPVYGNENSKITFVMVGCFTCPFSKKASVDVRKIIEDYKDKVEFRFITFPIPTHEFAHRSAIAAECVYRKDKELYWEYIFRLFDENNLNDETIKLHAQGVNNFTEFEKCYDSKETEKFVNDSVEFGKSINIYGTPTFFINDVKLVGPKPYRQLKAVIEENE